MGAYHWVCPDCGPHISADEDGSCAMCGRDATQAACLGQVCGDRLAAAEARATAAEGALGRIIHAYSHPQTHTGTDVDNAIEAARAATQGDR